MIAVIMRAINKSSKQDCDLASF